MKNEREIRKELRKIKEDLKEYVDKGFDFIGSYLSADNLIVPGYCRKDDLVDFLILVGKFTTLKWILGEE